MKDFIYDYGLPATIISGIIMGTSSINDDYLIILYLTMLVILFLYLLCSDEI